MATKDLSVVNVLRKTAVMLSESSDYQWGHMGSCNCGYLAQQITHLNRRQIHSYAMQRCGDWNEQLNDYCPSSGLPIDDLISEMIRFGFDTDDLKNLERLSDTRILNSLPEGKRNLYFNIKSDVITYLTTWASILEEDCVDHIMLPDLYVNQAAV